MDTIFISFLPMFILLAVLYALLGAEYYREATKDKPLTKITTLTGVLWFLAWPVLMLLHVLIVTPIAFFNSWRKMPDE